MAVMVSEVYGSKHLGGNYTLLDGWIAVIGTLALAKLLPTYLVSLHSHDGGKTCVGPACFGDTHRIIAGLSLLSCLLALVLGRQTRPSYEFLKVHAELRAKDKRHGWAGCC